MDANCVLNLIVAGREKVLQLFLSGFYGTVSLGSCCKLWNCLHINLARILFIPQFRNAFKLMESHGDTKPVRLVTGCPSHRFPPRLGWFPLIFFLIILFIARKGRPANCWSTLSAFLTSLKHRFSVYTNQSRLPYIPGSRHIAASIGIRRSQFPSSSTL